MTVEVCGQLGRLLRLKRTLGGRTRVGHSSLFTHSRGEVFGELILMTLLFPLPSLLLLSDAQVFLSLRNVGTGADGGSLGADHASPVSS